MSASTLSPSACAVSVPAMQISDLRIFTEPQQGATYDTLLAVAKRTEALGFGAFFRSDHYLAMGDSNGLPGPSDAWITLAGLARDTSTIRLGTLVTPVTFRYPGVLAITVANVDQMSGGRVELGLGAGWFPNEHDANSIPFPSTGDRFDSLVDQLAIIDGMWNTPIGETFDYTGAVHSVKDSPALPKPTQTPLPIVMGGAGKTKTPALAAQYAAEFNTPFVSLDFFVAQTGRVRAACEAIGRERPMIYSAALIVCAGADEAEVTRRAAVLGREPAELRENGAAGTAREVAEKILAFHAAGADRVYLQVLDLDDLDHLDFIATEVAPLLA